MRDAQALSAIAKCFVPIGKCDWERLTSGSQWTGFIDAIRRIVQTDAPLGAVVRLGSEHLYLYPMQDYLAAGEIRALFAPPSWGDHEAFSRRHLWQAGADALSARLFADELCGVAALLEANEGDRAERHLLDRLAWLPVWRMRLAAIEGSAFYLGLVDVVVALWSRLSARDDAGDAERLRVGEHACV